VIGDKVLLSPRAHPERTFVAYADRKDLRQDAARGNLKIKVSAKIRDAAVKGARFDVRFTINRASLEIARQAVLHSNELPLGLLFPSRPTDNPRQELVSGKIRPINFTHQKGNEINGLQREAVEAILKNDVKDAPFILYGPPGTGKTETVVEVILQLVLDARKMSRVLACAPSNTAADVLACRLKRELRFSHHHDSQKMIRIYSTTREYGEMHKDLKECSNWDGKKEMFFVPKRDQIVNKDIRVVICTCFVGGQLRDFGVKKGDFDLVIVDEAGQATEPDCLAPAAAVLGDSEGRQNCGRLVLCGDPKQLGPMVLSREAQDTLSKSMLERILEMRAYKKHRGKYNSKLVVRLLDCYRMHKDILKLPSRMFYENELRAEGPPHDRLQNWNGLKARGLPIIFEGVRGKDMREGNSPSWFNNHEVEVVRDYVKQVTAGAGIRPQSIGIITPYRKQVHKIQKALGREFQDVSVGPVEDFQGQEKLVIIISTVRSNRHFLAFDRAHRLGFIDNPKRFNVAVTRAQALLVVVGDPKVLYHDKYWGELLRYCRDRGAYKGESLEGIEKAEKDDDYDAWEDQHLISSSVGLEGNRDDHEGPSWSRDG